MVFYNVFIIITIVGGNKMKKRYGEIFLFIICIFMVTGCNKLYSPEELIKKPENSEEIEIIKEVVDRALPPKAKLIIPRQIEDAAAINLVELDGVDKEKEVIAFYNSKDKSLELGFVVLKKVNGRWEKIDLINVNNCDDKENKNLNNQVFYDLNYAGFYDLDGNGKFEIVVKWDCNEQYKDEAVIYSLEDGVIAEVFKGKYTGMDIDDINEDGFQDILISEYNSKTYTLSISLYNYVNNTFTFGNRVDMLSDYDSGYFDLTIGKASENKKGVFVDIYVGAHSSYTELLVLENNKLRKVFNNYEEAYCKTYKIYPVKSIDVDGDGIIEIGLLSQPEGYDATPIKNIPWINTWYKWDGKYGLQFVMESYYDYDEGYKFDIPVQWKNNYTLKKSSSDHGQKTVFYYLKDDTKDDIKLLEIDVFDASIWQEKEQELKKLDEEYMIIDKNDESVFIAYLYNMIDDNSMILSEEVIKNNFTLLN
jgi:hypothetical protein